MKSNRLNFMLVLSILFQSFQTYQGEGKIIDFTESWHQFSECFFTILCELDEGHTFHRPVTLASYESVTFAHDELLKLLKLDVPFTTADLLSETFLKTELKKLLCHLTEDERKDLENEYGVASMNYMSAVCSQPLKWEVCQKVDEASAAYMEVFEQKVEKGQCQKVDDILHSSKI